MSNLLLEDNPLMVMPKLAEKIGLNESIILQQVHYWLKKKMHVKEGYYWTYNSYPKWKKQFPFWSESTIKRTIVKLEDMNLLIVGNYNKMKSDKTKWYRINYEELDKYKENEVFDGRECSNVESGQNDLTIGSNCTDDDTNMNRPLPKTSSKTSSDILKPIVPAKAETVVQANKMPDEMIEMILDYFNQKLNKTRGFSKTDSTTKLLNALYKAGYKDIGLYQYVIDNKYNDWINNEKYKKYLQPATLFAKENFEKYMEQDEISLTPATNNNNQRSIWEVEAYGSQTSESIDGYGRNDVQKLLQY